MTSHESGPALGADYDTSWARRPLPHLFRRTIAALQRAREAGEEGIAAVEREVAGIDGAAIEDLVARVSVLADENPEIAHLELNPVSTNPTGLDVLGARITLAPHSLRQDSGRRAMT